MVDENAKESKHPYGTSLLARDTPENRQAWGPSGVGEVAVAESVCTPNGECPYYRYTQDATRQGGAEKTPIHLLIASFRDKLCPRTLHNAFQHAEGPHRLYIRVIEQTKAGSDLVDDAGCWERYCQDYNKDCHEFQGNVRIVHVDASQAKGPTDARSKLSAMVYWDYVHRNDPTELDFQPVQLQDFCMQTDSHMDFSDNWDTQLIFMHHRTKNDYAVLSTYVADISQNNQHVKVVPNLCMVTFQATIRNWGTKECRNLVKPKLTTMWGAGLSFHRCHAEIQVPVDPYLDQVFDGEEGSRALRFFTYGYDVYTPDEVLVTHDYHGHQSNPVVHTWGGQGTKPTIEEHESKWSWTKEIEEAKPGVTTFGTRRVNMMLGIGNKEYSQEEQDEIKRMRQSRYGLGTRRTLAQASEFTGINLREKQMVANKCGNLIWVPFVESPDYGVGEYLARGLAGEVDLDVVVARSSLRISQKEPNNRVATNGIGIISALLLAALAVLRFVSGKRQKDSRHKN